MFIHRNVHSSISHKSGNDVSPSTNKWITKMWYVHTVEYFLAIKRDEAQIHATMWVNLENIMLTESGQSQKGTRCMIPFTWIVQNRKIYKDSKQISGCRGWGRGEREMTASRGRVSFERDKNIPKLDCDDGCTLWEYTIKTIELYPLRGWIWGLPWWRSG